MDSETTTTAVLELIQNYYLHLMTLNIAGHFAVNL